MKLKLILQEINELAYKKWKRDNVTYRGMKELGKDNQVYGSFGNGLYTVPASNKAMAKQYGDLYFVVNAIPKNPKVVESLNSAEIFRYKLKSEALGLDPNGMNDLREFDKQGLKFEEEMVKKGYDGMIIKGREMVNYKPENVKYFKTENELMRWYSENVE